MGVKWSKASPKTSPEKQLTECEICIVFRISETEFPQPVLQSDLRDLADMVMDTLWVDIGNGSLALSEESVTHVIVRRLVDGNEKEIIALKEAEEDEDSPLADGALTGAAVST